MNPSSIVSAQSAAASTFGNGRAIMPSQDESVWARLDRNFEKFQVPAGSTAFTAAAVSAASRAAEWTATARRGGAPI